MKSDLIAGASTPAFPKLMEKQFNGKTIVAIFSDEESATVVYSEHHGYVVGNIYDEDESTFKDFTGKITLSN